MIEKGLYDYLTNHAGFTTVFGDRLYPQVIPQKSTLPAAAYNRVAGTSHQVMSGVTGLAQARIQIKVRANKPDEAKEAAEAVRLALDGYPGGTMGDITVQSCLSIPGSEHDEYEKVPGLIEYFGVNRDFEFFYEEAKPSFS